MVEELPPLLATVTSLIRLYLNVFCCRLAKYKQLVQDSLIFHGTLLRRLNEYYVLFCPPPVQDFV